MELFKIYYKFLLGFLLIPYHSDIGIYWESSIFLTSFDIHTPLGEYFIKTGYKMNLPNNTQQSSYLGHQTKLYPTSKMFVMG